MKKVNVTLSSEVEYFRNCLPRFYLIGVFAETGIRWDRVKNNYNNHQGRFYIDNERDMDEEDKPYGQKVNVCFKMADIIIKNEVKVVSGSEEEKHLKTTVNHFIDLLEGNKEYIPCEVEVLMAMAYANSLRSSCLQRKVGAIIEDQFGNVFSAGYNEVPIMERPCLSDWGKCYRKHLQEETLEKVNEKYPNNDNAMEVAKFLSKRFKHLDHCRALHAEERAILNVLISGSGTSLKNSTIFTTTYPCNLCANKIVHVGISKVIYLEPYTHPEAKKILDNSSVKQEHFEGVLYNGYFRFMEVKKE